MRVLHVIPGIAPRYGGPSSAVLERCRALEEQGVESLVVTTDADGENRIQAGLGQVTTYRGVKVIFFRRQWSEGFKYSRPLASWLLANVNKFDLVHIDALFSHSSLAAARACRAYGVPYVVRPLGSLSEWSIRQKRLQKLILWHLGVRDMLEGAAAVQFTSEQEAGQARNGYSVSRSVVIPLGVAQQAGPEVAPDLFRSRHSVGARPYVLTLSRLHPVKGLDLLIRSFVKATQRRALSEWRLVLAGEGDPAYVGRLKRLAEECGGSGCVEFAGWLEGDLKLSALKGAALLAQPSYHENFGCSIAEALSCEVPVLVSPKVGLAGEVAKRCAGWVVALEEGALVAALEEAMTRDDERVRRGLAGRELIRERLAWPAVAAELARLYRLAIKEQEQSVQHAVGQRVLPGPLRTR